MANGYKTVRAQSLDGEIHLVLIEFELGDVSNDKKELVQKNVMKIF